MFNCAGCKAKDEEIKHLRQLVDSILIGKGLQPVLPPVAASTDKEPQEIDVPEDIPVDDPAITFGGRD